MIEDKKFLLEILFPIGYVGEFLYNPNDYSEMNWHWEEFKNTYKTLWKRIK